MLDSEVLYHVGFTMFKPVIMFKIGILKGGQGSEILKK